MPCRRRARPDGPCVKLVWIYGPPAAGKFTIGSALADLTGYAFFHNHLTVAAVHPVFPTDPWRSRMLKRLRGDMIEAAAEAGVDVIFTLAYSGAVDDPWVDATRGRVERHAGSVCFVRLHAPPAELLRRVTAPHRRSMGKVADPDRLVERLAARDHFATVPGVPHLQIDTSATPPELAAQRVVDHYDLLGPARRAQPGVY